MRSKVALLISQVVLLLALPGKGKKSARGGSSQDSPLVVDDGSPLHPVLLFRKPADSNGQLEPVQEGFDVLRAQREPFAIISAMGPTRTGKSSLLGRAFMRGPSENLFEIGSGVTSFTGGIWISSRPQILKKGDGSKVRVLFIDTEGFSGLGGLTSQTYEANLFGIVYLMSSAVVFSSMFPVDASTVSKLQGHCNHAIRVINELRGVDKWEAHRLPKLAWAVQGFNLYSLQNSGMTADQLLGSLSNTSQPMKGAQASKPTSDQMGSGKAATLFNSISWDLFSSIQLLPVRRPHADDEVVANLGNYPSSHLKPEYLSDTDAVRRSALEGILPVHRCRGNVKNGRPGKCPMRMLDGPTFATDIERWLKYGKIVENNGQAAANETEVMESFALFHGLWFERECKHLLYILNSKLNKAKVASAGALKDREKIMQEVLKRVAGLPKAAMVQTVQRADFWLYPGKIATWSETQGPTKALECSQRIFVKRKEWERALVGKERYQEQYNKALQEWQSAHPGEQAPPFKVTKNEDGTISLEALPEPEMQKMRENPNAQKMASLAAAIANSKDKGPIDDIMGKAREECFVVYD